MRKIKLIITSLSLTLLPFMSEAQYKFIEKIDKKGNDVVIPYSKYVLDNGLTVIIHEDHSDPIVHVDVTYHVGSAREEIGKSGFAHFFEHMMFQGSDNVADEQHFKIITEAGGTLNGTTNRDRTNYFETVPKNQLEKILWLEADRMGFFLDAVTQEKFEIQRATVKNERGQNYDNRPYGLVSEYASKHLYPYGHPYSWLTIGYVEDLDRVNVNDLKNFFLRWYGPNNAVLTIGGDVNTEEVMQLVTKYFGSIPRGPEVKNMAPNYPQLTEDRYLVMEDRYAKLPMLHIVYPTPQFYTKDEAALDCLAEIIGQGKSSILYKNLTKTQKAIEVSTYNYASELAGEFTIRIVPAPGHTLSEMDQEVKNAFIEFEKRGVTQEDIDKFIAQLESSTIFSLESVNRKVSQLAAFQTFLGDANYIGKYLDLYRSLTPADVMNAYNKYIKNKGSIRLSVTTKDHTENAGNSNYQVDSTGYVAPDYGYEGLVYNKAQDNFDRSKMPGAYGDLNVVLPEFWTEKHNNINFIGTQNDEMPVVTLQITFPGGRLLEPADKSGLASLFAAMMNEDTKTMTAEEFSKALENLGSSIYFNSSLDGVSVSVRSLSKNIDKTLDLLRLKLSEPKFTQEAFDKNKKQYIEGYKNSLTRPANIASNIFNKILFGETVLGRIPSGNEQTLSNITLADIENFYAKYITIKDAEVIYVGSLKKDDIIKKLSFLKQMPNRSITIPTVPTLRPITNDSNKPTLYFVHVPNAAQTEFRVGNITDMKYDAHGDYFKSSIMNFPLGGVFNSRLNLYLREEKGWTYGARSGFGGNKYMGNFVFSAGINANATGEALNDVLRIIAEYKSKGVEKEELEFTKKAKIQSEARMYETNNQKLGYLYEILKYNLPKDIAKTQNNIIKNITQEEINVLAQNKLPDTKDFIILLVGDNKHITDEMKEKFNIIYLDREGEVIK